ncbi:MAG: hypothetical protein B6229_00400 [Spirochaetaceae bacterium 4572_7]|nr:MAG: hypothetical protein B6229_00400 [Spirochaetaceae bacterium 4572_7]
MTKQIDFYIDKNIVDGFYNSLKRYIIAYGGRGSGKTMQFAALSILYAIKNPNSRILAIRGSQNRISESSLQMMKDVIFMMGYEEYFTMTENTLKCHNGSEFIFYGARNYHTFKSLRGINLCFVDEATELSKSAWETLIPTIREDGSRFLISFNPEKEEDWVYQTFIVEQHPEAYVIKMNYNDNPYFPKVLRQEMEWDKSRNTAKYLHIWEGELISLTEGALWNYDMIKHSKAADIEDYEKIVVAIDPSVTSKATSDACGLIVGGRLKKNRYDILSDKTAIMSPKTWATTAVQLYNYYQADYIVYESNQGGDLIKTVIGDLDRSIKCYPVHARRGKKVRAEEILYLYEEGYVTHTKHFKTLESEMVTFTGDKKDKSPNALDAMVYCLKSLTPNKVRVQRGTHPGQMGSMRLRH